MQNRCEKQFQGTEGYNVKWEIRIREKQGKQGIVRTRPGHEEIMTKNLAQKHTPSALLLDPFGIALRAKGGLCGPLHYLVKL